MPGADVSPDCEPFLVALSSIADGEVSSIEGRLLDRHLGTCADCRAFAAGIGATLDLAGRSRRTRRRLGDLAALSDLVARWSVMRVVLGVLAIEVIVLSARDLVVPGPDGHDTRHLAAFTLAYGVLLTVVTIRPSRAPAALPAAAVLGGALAITAVVDLAAGRVPLVGEALHLPELLSVIVLWRMARPGRASVFRTRRRGAARTPRPVATSRPR
jgi:predicted anti-sigma-YlaC factor YlaD